MPALRHLANWLKTTTLAEVGQGSRVWALYSVEFLTFPLKTNQLLDSRRIDFGTAVASTHV